MVSSLLVERDLGSQRVQDTLSESLRRGTDENVYHYATQMSLVLRVMTLVTIKATLRVPGADAVRALTSKMHQRVHTYLVGTCNIEPEKAKKYRERIVRFATVGKDGLFMVESVHVLLGERPSGDPIVLVAGSFPELERLFTRALTVLSIVLPDIFHETVRAAFLKWMWKFERESSLKPLQRAETFRDKLWGRMMFAYANMVQRVLTDDSRRSIWPCFHPFLAVAGSALDASVPGEYAGAYQNIHQAYSHGIQGDPKAGFTYDGYKPGGSTVKIPSVTYGASAAAAAEKIAYVCARCGKKTVRGKKTPPPKGPIAPWADKAGRAKLAGGPPEEEQEPPETVTDDGITSKVPGADVKAFAFFMGRDEGWDGKANKPCAEDARSHAFPGKFAGCRRGAKCQYAHMHEKTKDGEDGWLPDSDVEMLKKIQDKMPLSKKLAGVK